MVDKHGNIKGERVVNDKTQKLGKQMLGVIKSFKWTPAKCNGKFVSMIVKRKMIIDVRSNKTAANIAFVLLAPQYGASTFLLLIICSNLAVILF
jgi:hypothetical protein